MAESDSDASRPQSQLSLDSSSGDGAEESALITTSPSGPHTMSTESVSTESAGSAHTVRGGTMPPTPSYPFPVMAKGQSSTPGENPATHKPFTTLSPTVTPNLAKLAKHKVSEDFRASGHLGTSASPTPESSRATAFDSSASPRPSALDIAVTIQSEPGLVGWWSQVTQVLKHTFGAERASLAVATDSTDVENVPWAQLATFSMGEEDGLSRVTNEPQSSKSSMQGILSPDPSTADGSRDRGLSATFKDLGLSALGGPPTANRPKLQSRHSYAGNSSTHNHSGSDLHTTSNSYNKAGPRSPLRNVQSEEEDTLRLSAELLRRHDFEEMKTRPLSDDLYSTERPAQGNILSPVQPLETEADPLLSTPGVLRVLSRNTATVLTREYLISNQKPSDQSHPHNTLNNAKASRHASSRLSPGQQSKVQSGTKENSRPSASVKAPRTSRRRASGTSSKGSPVVSARNVSYGNAASTPVYEDYEQMPGTPWAQSPAPSPAAHADSNDNPFFSNVPDQDAFLEDVPEHPFDDENQIPAIGTDRSRTIIQLPLIHPSSRLSQTQGSKTMREDPSAKQKGHHGNDEKHGRSRHSSQRSADEHTFKRVPIAILSILAPIVPYPFDLLETINDLSPMLATSFYAARSYSNLLVETAAIARRRQDLGIKLNPRDEQSLNSIAVATGLNFVNSSRERVASPTSVSSSASTSTQSTQALHSPKGSAGGGSAAVTPAWEGHDTNYRSGRMQIPNRSPGPGRSPGARSPGSESREVRDDYFHSVLSQKRYVEDTSGSKTPSRATAAARPGKTSKKHMIHSQGANFANTQPSLPGSTAFNNEDSPETLHVPEDTDNVFKEPSSSILRTMIDNGATQQFIAERDKGNLVWANSKFLAYRNTTKENVHEQLWKNIYHKDVKRFQREWDKALGSGEQLSHQVRLKRFDGQYRWFHIRFLPLKDKHGITKYWHGQAMDIHDLHEAEVKAAKSKEKAASESKYRAIANSLPVIVFAASVPTGMTFANTQWLSYSGQGLEEALGFGFLDHIHPDDLVKCRFPGFDAKPSKIAKHVRPSPAQHTESELSVSSAADSDETNSTVKLPSGADGDRSELFFPNELLRELNKDGIIMCNKDEQNNLSITTEMRLKTRKGEYRWHLVQGSFIESVNFGKGEAQWFIACTDISNQKQNEAKIQQANSALENVNETLEKEMQRKMGYLSSMSHEIRTPLNGIIGNLQFLINSGLEESAGEWAHGAQEAAKNMHDLINDILDLSKAEANMLKLAAHWFSPRGLNEQVMDMLNSKASEKEVELSNECADDVPRTIRGDSGRIRQVLLNLVGNAIKFTAIGEVVIKCDVLGNVPDDLELPELEGNETLIRWTVTDTGSGFTEEDKKLLFKPYSQIKNKNTRDAGGTGLGLILCKTMVTLHGGAIEAEGKPGLGSAFTFFARFKTRKDSTPSHNSGVPQGASSGKPALPTPIAESPLNRPNVLSDAPRGSPGPLSDSSSALSANSTENRTSVRSSISTTDSVIPIELHLPSDQSISKSDPTKRDGVISAPLVSSPARYSTMAPARINSAPLKVLNGRGSPLISPKSSQPQKLATADPERSHFRPPMLSVLVVCPSADTRRITCDQIKFTAPRSAPCNITSESNVETALKLLQGNDPVTFTHIVFRVTSDEAMQKSIQEILGNPMHSQACIVIITNQTQVKLLAENAPELDLDALSKADRVKIVLKPAHTHKLAKIFDPFNENVLATEDPKEAKRKEEKRLQRDAYAMFKKVMGNKGIKIIAVEDNKLQMDILYNFLARICFLDVVKAWNGQECLDLYRSNHTGYSVIITDIEMPVMDGLTMCRRIRELEEYQSWPPVPVVSLSANTFYEGWTQSSNAGFTHYCGKPVNFRDLGHILLELTNRAIPHMFLRDRQMPKAMLKKLGLLPSGEDSDEEVEL